jgi:hypothetical protein
MGVEWGRRRIYREFLSVSFLEDSLLEIWEDDDIDEICYKGGRWTKLVQHLVRWICVMLNF